MSEEEKSIENEQDKLGRTNTMDSLVSQKSDWSNDPNSFVRCSPQHREQLKHNAMIIKSNIKRTYMTKKIYAV